MKNEKKGETFHSQFITCHNKSSAPVKLQCLLISWKFTTITVSLSFFPCWEILNEESVKDIWEFGTGWSWCKMIILLMLSPSVKTAYLEIFQFSGNLRKRTKTTWKCVWFWIWDNLHHLRRGVNFRQATDHPVTFPETLKYWVAVQRGQSYLMGRRWLFSLGWQPF